MLQLTDKARKELLDYFADKEKAPIRVYLSPGGCSGPRLAMALDEPKETDEVFDLEGGLTFVVEKQLLVAASPISVDVTYTGFTINSSLQLGGGGGCSCASTGGCGSGCGTGGEQDSGGGGSCGCH